MSGPSLLGQGSIYFAINAPVGATLNENSSVFIDDLYLGVDNTSIYQVAQANEIIEELKILLSEWS